MEVNTGKVETGQSGSPVGAGDLAICCEDQRT
jgi:hypothetical protein